MKVAFHVDQLWFRVPGGIGTYIRELAPRLAAEPGVEVVPFRSSWPADATVSWTLPMRGVTTGRHTTHYPLWDLLGIPALPSALRVCDLIHATNPSAVPPAGPGQALVVTVHDLAFERFPEAFPARWRWLYRAGVRAAARRADAILAPSQATADDLSARTDVDPTKVFVTPLAASLPARGADPSEALRRLGVPSPYVLFVGTLEPRKNVVRLVRAFRALAGEIPHALVLAGPDGWRMADLERELELDHSARIVRTGAVGPDELDALYRAAATFCYLSLYEGFGLPVLEAMQRGAPVVASATPAIAEVAGDAALLVEPTDADAIAAALRRVLTDPALADELRRKGEARVAEFSWERTARTTLDAYREVTGSG